MTYTKEQAQIEIQKLVENFRAHEATLEHAPEAQIENDFIRPLFRYLNWNTENAGLSHAHYEFKVQVTNKKGLRPDYILNLDGRDVLVMDAKQVKYKMHDPRWLYQVYSYAYSTQNSKPSEKIDFAILTDFQEFIVLDCTLFAAKPEAVNNFRVIDWEYGDYVEKFDELWELFERGNVLTASKNREGGLWSRYLSPQKVKSNRVPPDKAFLAQMDDEKKGWRVLLAKDMKKRNPAADGELITAAVQLLIDRLVFIKALSDREVDKDYLGELAQTVEESGLSDEDTGWFQACKNIFDELNNFYNGSIFEERRELENVTVSNKVVRSVITDLLPENSPYNFAVLPVEILGTIYERFLGRVVRTTDKQVKIEEKPEVRKAGGVYYTPQYIVDYIVENTLGKLLDESKTPADVARLRVLDPACGSGSFLLGAYSKLIQWHKDYFARAGKEKRDRELFYKDESGQIRLTAKLKREILKNNLFGVDIDPQAVEVTRFSLSLKALEDLREGELTEERSLFHQTVLPDLSQNIKNGNSLIGTDYFGLVAPTADELKAIKPFDWKSEFKTIMENGGFDCVIGNPPYIRMETFKEIKTYLKANYACHDERSDIYAYIMERSHKVLKSGGKFGMIVSNKFLRANYGKPLRDFIQKNANINQIVDFAGLPVFKGATVRTIVFISTHEEQKEDLLYTPPLPMTIFEGVETSSLTIESAITETTYKVSKNALSQSVWNFAEADVKALLEKIQENSVSLDEYCGGKIGYGIKSGLDKAFVIDESQRIAIISKDPKSAELIKPYLNGKDVRRYQVDFRKRFLIYTRHDIDIKQYPGIQEYLKPFKNDLQNRATKQEWYELQQPQFNYSVYFDNPKIVLPDIATEPRFAIDETGYYGATTIFFIPVRDLYLLGLLNSKIGFVYFKETCAALEGANDVYLRFKRQYLQGFPVRTIDFANPADKSAHEKMVGLVSQMLELHKSKARAKTQSEVDVYERQIKAVDESIDQLVYELYGLTEDEIKIVEGK